MPVGIYRSQKSFFTSTTSSKTSAIVSNDDKEIELPFSLSFNFTWNVLVRDFPLVKKAFTGADFTFEIPKKDKKENL